jgi:hypothetical protein
MFQKKVAEKTKIPILFSITFFRKLCHISDNEEKYEYGRIRKATDDNIIQHIKDAICMSDN